MNERHDDLVKDVFQRAIDMPAAERVEFVTAACGSDDEARARVLALLSAFDGAGDFLGSPTRHPRPDSSPSRGVPIEGAGDRIGPYKLLQSIGEGGFGVVYMAEQEHPIQRRVALKLIKPGMDSKQVIARFEAERQALALMDHPNIARVFDAGTTPSGRPYFVMELVKGIPITDYCDDYGLDARERLELFVSVCRAVEHAHEAGIVHRDLKPSNVLVTLHDGVAVPKVIDFGVAKATRSKLTDSTLFTEFHQFIGTPSYMSPEQAAYEGLDVDARSDVYSLGVLLYELLTGTTPHDSHALKRAAYFEVLRILKEDEPPRPSTRVTTMGAGSDVHAKRRSADRAGLAKLLRGDLDSIVMKALEKDRRRRYGSASEMADDIGRYFESKPIEARPPSRLYRAQKLLRRRRGRFAAAAVLILAVLVDVGYVTWQGSRMSALSGPAGDGRSGTARLYASEEGACLEGARPSPDGTLVAYLEMCAEPFGVHLLDVETGRSEPLAVEGPYDGLAWAPDGRSLLAGRPAPGRRTHPVILDLETGDGPTPRALVGLSFSPSDWSSDGEHVAGTLYESETAVTTAVVSLASGDILKLTTRPQRDAARATFSPDGRYVAFGDDIEGQADLFVVDLESGERSRLTTTPEREGAALWSPGGSSVAFVDPQGLWLVPVTEGRPTAPPRFGRRDRGWVAGWNETGFYYINQNDLTRAHRIPVDPRSARAAGAPEPLDLPSVNPGLFAWSPDMRRAAVHGEDGVMHIVEGGRARAYPIEPTRAQAEKLWWSADGTRVLYTLRAGSRADRTVDAVRVLDLSTGTTRPLHAPIEGMVYAHVAPDGHTMASFRSSAGSQWDRLVVSEIGARDGRVVATAGDLGSLARLRLQPLFSPTGDHILYERYRQGANGGLELWVVAADGSDDRKVAEADYGIFAPQWDPSGRWIAFMASDTDTSRWSLRIVDWRSGTSHRIEAFEGLQRPQLLDWSPDGAWIAVRETTGGTELWRSPDPLEGG